MIALLVPIRDIFYFNIWSDDDGELHNTLELNTYLFNFEINTLLLQPDAVLYVLVDNDFSQDNCASLLTTQGGYLKQAWETQLLPYLSEFFTRYYAKPSPVKIVTSIDIDAYTQRFTPCEAKWTLQAHSYRLFLRHFSETLTEENIRQYALHEFKLKSSYIEPADIDRQLFQLRLDHLHQVYPFFPVARALIVLDVDLTLLDNLRSSLWQTTLVNWSVITEIERLCTQLEAAGVSVELLAMTARDRLADARFASLNHPFALRSVVAEASRLLERKIRVDDILSFSYPVNVKGKPKTRKFSHLDTMLSYGFIDANYQLIVLFDDCDYECDQRLILQDREEFQARYQTTLLAIQVQRNGYLHAEEFDMLSIDLDECLRPLSEPSCRWKLRLYPQVDLQPKPNVEADTHAEAVVSPKL